MDVARSSKVKLKKQLRFVFIVFVIVLIVSLVAVGISRLKPAAPGVDRATLWIDTVKRGQMLREVRGIGTLVPEYIRFVPAPTEGRVERVFIKPGMRVSADTVLVELVNPKIEQEAVDAEFQVKAAEADLANLRVRIENEHMTQQSATASVQADYSQAKLQGDTDEVLAKDGLVPELNLKLSRVRLKELENRLSIERQRLDKTSQSAKAQIASQQAKVDQLRALAKLKRSQVIALSVTAQTSGIVQEVSVEAGQQVTPGANLARVADQSNLKAELRIAETQMKDVQVGQVVSVDTRNGLIAGRVSRIDPAAKDGTVMVDVALEGELPQGARPDLSVDGTIELEKLNNVLYVGRPAFGQGGSTLGFFKLEPDGKMAVRVSVKVGKASVNTIEILEGLREGDQVILSDTSQWDSYNRIELQ